MIRCRSGKEVAAVKEERRKRMGELVATRRTMTMEELCAYFDVSMNTVRSDVVYLVQTGAVEKIYGGVRAKDQKQAPLFASRAQLRTDQKKAIALRAEALIEDGDILFLDAGTTTMHLIDCLSPWKKVTVVTASLQVIRKAVAMENVQLIVLPGAYNRRTNSLCDVGTLEYLARYQFTKAFMGVSGVSEDGKLNVSTYLEFEIKRTALSRSQEKYLLADSGKFGGTGLMSYGELSDMTALITDSDCPADVRDYCGERKLPVIYAK